MKGGIKMKKFYFGLLSTIIISAAIVAAAVLIWETPADKCEDTDGGLVWDVRGTVFANYNDNETSYTDFCYNSTSIGEYRCTTGNTTAFKVQLFRENCAAVNQSTCIAGVCG